MVKLSLLTQLLLCAASLFIATAPVLAQTPHNRFLWSRHTQQDSQGYYYQPAGLCEDYPESARTQERLDRDFAVLRETGVKLLRVGISWEDVEYERGRYDWSVWDKLVDTAVRNHVQLIPYVCYAPSWAAPAYDLAPYDPKYFEAFMRTIASRYKSKVHSWELWNEPDNAGFWQGGIHHFADLVKAGAKGVREADPKATIVLGGISGDIDFLRQLCTQYQIEDYVDVINFHAYFETWTDDRIEYLSSYIKQMAGAGGGKSSPLDFWLAEFGYSDLLPGSGSGIYDFPYQHTAEFQAVALLRFHILALATGLVSLTTWYRINDLPPTVGVIGDDNNRFLGVVDVDGKKKPAFYALRFYNNLFNQPARCVDHLAKITRTAGSQSVVHIFERKDRTIIVTAWLRTPQPGDLPAGAIADNRHEEVAVSLPFLKHAKMVMYDPSGQVQKTGALLDGTKLSHLILTGPGIFIARIR
jgi:hypothetical protein